MEEAIALLVPWILLIAPMLAWIRIGAKRFTVARYKSGEIIERQRHRWRSLLVTKAAIREWQRRGRRTHIQSEEAWRDMTRHSLQSEAQIHASAGLIILWIQLVLSLSALHLAYVILADNFHWFGSDVQIAPTVVDTASRGAFFDLVESYKLDFSKSATEIDTPLFQTHAFLFRSAWSLAAGALVFSLGALWHDLMCYARRIIHERKAEPLMSIGEIADRTEPSRTVLTDDLETSELNMEIWRRRGWPNTKLEMNIKSLKLKIAATAKLDSEAKSDD